MNVNDMSKVLNIINDVFQEKKAELRRLGVDDWILDRVFKIFTCSIFDNRQIICKKIELPGAKITTPKKRISKPIVENWDIGNIPFITPEAAHDYTYKMIKSTGYGKVENHHKNFKFFANLIENHVNKDVKIGCGIDHFVIAINSQYTSTDIIYIVRSDLDGTRASFSWSDCAKKCTKSENKLYNAMREYTYDYCLDFRRASRKICKICNKKKTDDELHVDHNNPTFIQLYRDFLKINKLSIPTLFDKNNGKEKFTAQDLDFANSWSEYHAINAALQMLCKDCHKIKTKSDKKK